MPLESVIEWLKVFVEISIDMRLKIEEMTTKDLEVISYLKQVDGKSREDLVAQLIDFESIDNLKAQSSSHFSRDDLWSFLTAENTMSPLGIRLKLLDVSELETEGSEDII